MKANEGESANLWKQLYSLCDSKYDICQFAYLILKVSGPNPKKGISKKLARMFLQMNNLPNTESEFIFVNKAIKRKKTQFYK